MVPWFCAESSCFRALRPLSQCSGLPGPLQPQIPRKVESQVSQRAPTEVNLGRSRTGTTLRPGLSPWHRASPGETAARRSPTPAQTPSARRVAERCSRQTATSYSSPHQEPDPRAERRWTATTVDTIRWGPVASRGAQWSHNHLRQRHLCLLSAQGLNETFTIRRPLGQNHQLPRRQPSQTGGVARRDAFQQLLRATTTQLPGGNLHRQRPGSGAAGTVTLQIGRLCPTSFAQSRNPSGNLHLDNLGGHSSAAPSPDNSPTSTPGGCYPSTAAFTLTTTSAAGRVGGIREHVDLSLKWAQPSSLSSRDAHPLLKGRPLQNVIDRGRPWSSRFVHLGRFGIDPELRDRVCRRGRCRATASPHAVSKDLLTPVSEGASRQNPTGSSSPGARKSELLAIPRSGFSHRTIKGSIRRCSTRLPQSPACPQTKWCPPRSTAWLLVASVENQ